MIAFEEAKKIACAADKSIPRIYKARESKDFYEFGMTKSDWDGREETLPVGNTVIRIEKKTGKWRFIGVLETLHDIENNIVFEEIEF